MKNNLKLLSSKLVSLVMIIGTTTSGALSSAYAGGDKHGVNDKVKLLQLPPMLVLLLQH